LQQTIDKELGVEGAIDIHSVVFKDFRFESGVKTAFERANEERANIQAEQYRFEQESIKVDTATKEGEAAGARLLAEAKKKAEALEVEGKAIRENPEVLTIRQIEAWKDGGSKVPQTLIIGGGESGGN